MRNDKTCLTEFVQLLLNEQLASPDEIKRVFEKHDGLEALVEDDLPITAYEELGWLCGEKLSAAELSSFLYRFADELQRFEAERYYFVEALAVKASERLGTAELAQVLNASPAKYREYVNLRLRGVT